jgi:hypothetical protein
VAGGFLQLRGAAPGAISPLAVRPIESNIR